MRVEAAPLSRMQTVKFGGALCLPDKFPYPWAQFHKYKHYKKDYFITLLK